MAKKSKKSITAEQEALEHLVQATRRARANAGLIKGISKYVNLEPDEIYDYLLLAWADHKGNTAVVYGAVGTSLTQSVGFNAGMFFMPGITNLSVSGTVNQTYLDEAFIMIQRPFAQRIISLESRETDRPIYPRRCRKPVCFLTLRGASQQHSARISVAVGIGIDTGVAIPLAAVSYSIAGFDAGASITFTAFKFDEEKPAFYANSRSEALKTDFGNHLGTRHTHYLKREIVPWLKEMRDKYALRMDRNPALKSALKSLPSLNIPFYKASTIKVLGKLQQILDVPDLDSWFTATDKTKLEEYRALLLEARQAVSDYRIATKGTATDNAKTVPGLCFLTLGNTKKEGTVNLSVGTNPAAGVFGGSSGVGTDQTSAVGGTNLADEQKGWLSAGIPSVTLGAGVACNYKKVNTHYRYQTYALSTASRHRLVMTQDVKISYTEHEATVAVAAGVDLMVGRDIDLTDVHVSDTNLQRLKKVQAAQAKSKSWGKRSMHYRAVTAYWNYDEVTAAGMKLMNGSGVSFGISLSMRKILRIAYKSHKTGLSFNDRTHLAPHAKALRVSVDELEAFMKSLLIPQFGENDERKGPPVPDFKKQIEGYAGCMEAGAVLVEASYRLVEPLLVKKGKTGSNETDLQPEDLTSGQPWSDFFYGMLFARPTTAKLKLESIRLRVRLGDTSDHGKNIFRLGLYLFGSGYSLDITRVRSSGNEGILTIHTHSFLPVDQRVGRTTGALEDSVPPVTLVPHRFTT